MEFIQYRIWNDCINNCSFCYLGKPVVTPLEDKKNNLKLFNDFTKNNKIDKLGIIGGEYFEGQLLNCEEEWVDLINTINSQNVRQLYITATLINKQYFLYETLERIQVPYMICTSYDTKGRFHTQEKKESWLKNINELHDKGVNVFCTCVPTQELLDNEFFKELPHWLGFNLCSPHMSLEWIKEHSEDYHINFIKDNNLFNLPKRDDFLKWIVNYPKIIINYLDLQYNHSNIVYHIENKQIVPEVTGRLEPGHWWLNKKCGHPIVSQCYIDSDKCMMCDLQELI